MPTNALNVKIVYIFKHNSPKLLHAFSLTYITFRKFLGQLYNIYTLYRQEFESA